MSTHSKFPAGSLFREDDLVFFTILEEASIHERHFILSKTFVKDLPTLLDDARQIKLIGSDGLMQNRETWETMHIKDTNLDIYAHASKIGLALKKYLNYAEANNRLGRFKTDYPMPSNPFSVDLPSRIQLSNPSSQESIKSIEFHLLQLVLPKARSRVTYHANQIGLSGLMIDSIAYTQVLRSIFSLSYRSLIEQPYREFCEQYSKQAIDMIVGLAPQHN